MNHNYILTFIISIFISFSALSQEETYIKDSTMLRQIYTEALGNGHCYENLRSLCKDVGSRLSGSVGAEMAVEWGFHKLSGYNFDTVYKQEVIVPHWERGTKEKGYYRTAENKIHEIDLLALGGSVSTNGVVEGEIIMFKTRAALKKATKKEVEGKIVFLSERMDPTIVNAFHSYGNAFTIRGHAAIWAAEKGAKAVIIRTLSLSENPFPNTGIMFYEEGVKKIPAAALSTKSATQLEKQIDEAKTPINFYFEMDCKLLPDVKSYNVIAEIKGNKYPNNVITFGGHLDSWDVAEGAHDDGAGIVHCMEALRILKDLEYKPQNTLRVVFFMNEENGNKGGITYADLAKKNNENQIYAIESDEGGFTPRGFDVQNNPKCLALVQSFAPLFAPYFLTQFENGWGGVCTSPLAKKYDDIALISFIPDSQRYFDIHHNANDVFENVNKRELELGAASISSLIYLLDSHY